MSSAPSTDPGEGRTRSVLEEEREFFLRSLRDLEAERAAGDIDAGDYTALRDDYTVRAAEVIRLLAALEGGPGPSGAGAEPDEESGAAGAAVGAESGAAGAAVGGEGAAAVQAEAPPTDGSRSGRRSSRRRRVTVGAVGAVFVVVLGLAVAHGAGLRLPGETVSGQATGADATDQLLISAQSELDGDHPVKAIADYQKVLDGDPHNPEALTGYGAILVETDQAQLLGRGVVMLAEAESADASYGPAYAYLGRGLVLLGDYPRAIKQLRTFLADNPGSALAPGARKLLSYAEKQQQKAPASTGSAPPATTGS